MPRILRIKVHTVKFGSGEWTAVIGIMEGTFTKPNAHGRWQDDPADWKALQDHNVLHWPLERWSNERKEYCSGIISLSWSRSSCLVERISEWICCLLQGIGEHQSCPDGPLSQTATAYGNRQSEVCSARWYPQLQGMYHLYYYLIISKML